MIGRWMLRLMQRTWKLGLAGKTLVVVIGLIVLLEAYMIGYLIASLILT